MNRSQDHLERIMNQLADSVLGLSDETIVAEVSESGADPKREAERTNQVLGKASEMVEDVTQRLANLGHNINSRYWWREQSAYYNHCLNCGLAVSFTTKTGKILGRAMDAPCSAVGGYKIA
jgi:hypothetical protein